MPLFLSYYGLTRKEALNLKHWEFESCRQFFYQQKARDALSNYQSVGMAFGGSKEDTKEYLTDLRERAGYNVKRRGDNVVSNSKVVGSAKVRAMGIFDNIRGIQPIDVYEDLRINKIDGYGDDATAKAT